MDRSTKVVLASCVLFVGVLVAFVFRRHDGQMVLPRPEASKLILLERIEPVSSARLHNRPMTATRADQRTNRFQPKAAHPFATILFPMKSGDPPPNLATRYPRQEDVEGGGWERPIGFPSSVAGKESKNLTKRMHKIVDGDTLARLAERYLGSSDRQMEIFETNRDVLSSPDLLPIGVELNISEKRPKRDDRQNRSTKRQLVPL